MDNNKYYLIQNKELFHCLDCNKMKDTTSGVYCDECGVEMCGECEEKHLCFEDEDENYDLIIQ